MEDKARSNQVELEKVTVEINEYRKQVTQLEMELESLRGTNEYLERNLAGLNSYFILLSMKKLKQRSLDNTIYYDSYYYDSYIMTRVAQARR